MMKIYNEVKINSLTLKNRIIRSATYEGASDIKGNPTGYISQLYKKLADGDIGAIITGYVGVNNQGRTTKLMPLFDCGDREESFRKTISYPQKKGVPVILQIAHGGGYANAKPVSKDLIAPSDFKFPLAVQKARAMTQIEIEDVINDFVTAIVRAKRTGYDGVQLHCAHGYLLCQFLSPRINKRNDHWGGSIENRFKIIEKILVRARNEVDNFPIWAKISAYSLDKGNITVNESIKTAKLLQKAGCDLIEVSCGSFLDGFSTVRCKKAPVQAYLNLSKRMKNANTISKFLISIFMPLVVSCPKPLENYNVDAALKIKQHIEIPVCLVGGLRDRIFIEKIIEDKKCDFISLSRPLIIEPNLVKRFRDEGQKKSRCINCSFCLIGCLEQPVKCYYGKIK